MTNDPLSCEDLRHALRSRNLSALAGSWLHELKGHLNVAVLAIQVTRRSLPPTDANERPLAQLQQIADKIWHVDQLAQSLVAPLQDTEEPLQAIDLRDAAAEAIRFAHAWQGSGGGVTIDPIAAESHTFVDARPRELALCATNLAANALAAMHGSGSLRIAVGRTGTESTLRVADSGPGMPADVLAELARKTWRWSDPSVLGLGLRVVQSIVRGLGARLRACTPPEGGSMVEVHFPASRLTI